MDRFGDALRGADVVRVTTCPLSRRPAAAGGPGLGSRIGDRQLSGERRR
jgi:hypothetical protein